VCGALIGVVGCGTLTGSMLPFILRKLGFDPATASAPFVATLVDVTGLCIYFGVALLILRGRCCSVPSRNRQKPAPGHDRVARNAKLDLDSRTEMSRSRRKFLYAIGGAGIVSAAWLALMGARQSATKIDHRRSQMESPIELVRRFCAAWSDNVGAAELAAFFTDRRRLP